MSRKYTQAQKEAVNRYLEGQIRFLVTMPKDDYARFAAYIESIGQSRNAFILEAISEKMSKE